MPYNLKQLSREAYCSAPPLPSTAICPPRLTREKEANRPRVPIYAAFDKVKAEVSLIKSVEFVADGFDEFDVKPDIEAPFDPRQFGDPLQVRLAALAIRPSPYSSSSSVGDPAGPSRIPERIPEAFGFRAKAASPQGTWAQQTQLREEDAPKAPIHGLGWRSASRRSLSVGKRSEPRGG